jgi:hypothetical protein
MQKTTLFPKPLIPVQFGMGVPFRDGDLIAVGRVPSRGVPFGPRPPGGAKLGKDRSTLDPLALMQRGIGVSIGV